MPRQGRRRAGHRSGLEHQRRRVRAQWQHLPDGEPRRPARDFEADARDIESSFLAGRDTTLVFLGQLPNRDVARARILDALKQGLSLISYVGHGGGAVWAAESILNSSDPTALLAQPRQPFMLTMNCLNRYFIAPFYESLAEGFLKTKDHAQTGAKPELLSVYHLFADPAMRVR